MKKGKKKYSSEQITEVLVEIILLFIATLMLSSGFISSVGWWLDFKSGFIESQLKNEEYIYFFAGIAYFLQLLLVYILALYYKLNINKKILRCFCAIISVVGLASLMASFTIESSIYSSTYVGDTTPFVMYTILFYLPITPSFLIHIFDRYRYKGKKK